jgi:hypothetical protein
MSLKILRVTIVIYLTYAGSEISRLRALFATRPWGVTNISKDNTKIFKNKTLIFFYYWVGSTFRADY